MKLRPQRAHPALRLWANGLMLCLSSLTLTAVGQPWIVTTSLPDGWQEHTLVYASGFLYNIGGASNSNAEGDGYHVFYSQVFSNGTIGVWKNTTPLPESVFDHTSVTSNGFVYVLGGTHWTPAVGHDFITNAVYYAKINLDGSLGSWQVANPLPVAAFFQSASVWNNRIYVIGGWWDNGNAGGLTNSVYSAEIQTNGSLSAWVAQTPMPDAIYAHCGVANGMLYVLGGIINNGAQIENRVNYSRINGDGNLVGWNQTTPVPQPLGSFAAVAANGRVYVIGGWNGSTAINGFSVGSVSGDGSLDNWSVATPLPQSLVYLAAAVSDSYIFVSGGAANSSTSASVYSMALPAPPAAPTLEARSLTNGNFQLQLASTTNTGFGLLASTNLTSWTNIGWGFTGTNGTLLFQDTNAAKFPRRFYRAKWPLP